MRESKLRKIYLSFTFLILLLLIHTSPLVIKTLIFSQKQFSINEDHSTPIISDPNAFISIWDTSKTSFGSSSSNQVKLPLSSSGTYNFLVKWGDGNQDTITSWNQAEVTHTYVSQGIYTINITGTIIGWRFNNGGDKLKLIEIKQWGCLRLGNEGSYFYGCSNLKLTATDNLNLQGTSSLYQAFMDCANLGSTGNMNGWNTSGVTNMAWMFEGAITFNQPIGNWDVSNVLNMSLMFCFARFFNQPIGNWDVSIVTDMHRMFNQADHFNQPIENWNVSSVMDMSWIFYDADSFNQPLGNWDVSSVSDMSGMFAAAYSFNQPLGNWDVSSVTDMSYMFGYADSFDQPLGNWDVSSVTDMSYMFDRVILSVQNYDDILIGWSQLSLQNGVVFDGGNSKYSPGAAENARNYIINTYGWAITDGGKLPVKPSAFTLSSDAENPDPDGDFNLNWTSSLYVNNYTVYSHSSYITEINGTLTVLANDITNLSLIMRGYTNGDYYFIVEAKNDFGSTLSNCLKVMVNKYPGNFTLSSDAGDPDPDGSFTLFWTSSIRANNYSVYKYSSYITEINESLTLLASGITDLALALNGYKDGTYYFIVVAHNNYDDTLSNCIKIEIELIQPSIPGYSIYILISLNLIMSILLIVNFRKKL